MSRLSNLVSGNTGKGNALAPSGNVATGNNANDAFEQMVATMFANMEARINANVAQTVEALMAKMGNAPQVASNAPDKVEEKQVDKVEDNAPVEPADARNPLTWLPERLEACHAGHNAGDPHTLVAIMTAIRDTLYPHWNVKGNSYPDNLKHLRQTPGNGGLSKADKIKVVLSYRDRLIQGNGKVEEEPAPVASEPVSQSPAVLLAWQKVAELEAKGYTKEQIANLLSIFNLPNVLANGNMPDPSKVETLATVHPPANRNMGKAAGRPSKDEWNYQLAHENTMALKGQLVPMYKALAHEYQAIDKKYKGQKAKIHKQTARENFKSRVSEISNAPTCGCKYGPSTTCMYAKENGLFTTGSNGRQYNLVYGDSSAYFSDK